MFYGDKIQDTRPLFFLSWKKYRAQQPLTPLEHQIVDVIQIHPEYHRFFEQSNESIAQNDSFEARENPFLHLGLHLALREQIATNRPSGIQLVFHQLAMQYSDSHFQVEHRMMEILAEWLWQAQQTGQFSEDGYLLELKKLLS